MPRWRLSHSTAAALQTGVQVLLAAALFAGLQLLAQRHNLRLDLTPTQRFVLTEQTRQIARAFETPVQVLAFYNEESTAMRRDLLDLLQQYQAVMPAMTFEIIDLDRSPARAQQYGVSSYNSGVVESGGRVIKLRSVSEEEVTGALLRLSRERQRTACFVTGHGEHAPGSTDERTGYSRIAKAVERERFRVDTLTAVGGDGVPERCTVLIMAGPTSALLPGEAERILAWLRAGGRLLLLVDRRTPDSYADLLAPLGVRAMDDVIVEEQNRFIGADAYYPLIAQFDGETFGTELRSAAVFPVARTVLPRREIPDDVGIRFLALTSQSSWALVEPPESLPADPRFRHGTDSRGPKPVGLLITLPPADADAPAGHAIVYGDADFAANNDVGKVGNQDLFLNSVAVLAEDRELIATGRRKPESERQIYLTEGQVRTIFWVAVVLSPGAALLIGGVVALRQRRRRGGR